MEQREYLKLQAMWMEAAKVVISSLQLLVLILLCLFVTTPAQPSSGRRVHHDYSRRFAQVTRQCQSLFPSATELSVDPNRADGQFAQLSFRDGDWSQDAGHDPLFPFHDLPEAAVPLVSFSLTEVQVHQRRRAFNASGLLSFTLPCNGGGCRPKEQENELWHGVAKFHIHFEGVYMETPSSSGSGDGDDGERVLCMLGNSALPMRRGRSNGTCSWDWVKDHGGETNIIEPSTTDAGGEANVLLVLRYPKAHTLTTRAVRGEMTSLGSKSDGAYFDAVRLVSRLSRYSWYKLRREDDEPDAAGCTNHHASFRDGDVAGHVYRDASFCDILGQFTSHNYGLLYVVPNWNCSSTDELFCSRPGPFEAAGGGGGDRVRSMAFTRSAVAVQDLQCAQAPPGGLDGIPPAAKVVAVFRFVAPWEDHPTAAKRTGLSGATLSAEGTWSASTGRLCMVACLGAGKGACHYRVTLYVPTAFSITRRSIVVGQITAADGSHYPLSFQQGLRHRQEWHRFGRSGEPVPMAYHYTKTTQAQEMKVVHGRASGFRDSFIARSLLSYPTIAGAADDLVSLSYLADDLGLDFQPTAKTPPFVPEWIEDPFIEFQILSIGNLVGRRYSPAFEGGSNLPVKVVEQTGSGHGVQKQQMINVSAVFTASRNDPAGGQSPVMLLEGVYSPEDGRMFLIGCRNVDAPWRVLSTIRDLEDGMDCSLRVTVEYPPTKNRWMASRAAKVTVTSTRNDDSDPLHFGRTELRTLPSYDHNLGVLPESTHGLLCIAMLSAIIAATVSQLRHVSSHGEVAPYVSLAMLGVQALGYGATLVTGARMVPAWPVYTYKMYADHMDYSVKALTLAALLLTAWLAQKVWVSRARVRARSPLEPGRVPGETPVLLCSFAVHLCCLLVVLGVHWLSTCGTSAAAAPPPPPSRETYADDGQPTPPLNLLCTWGHVVGRYVGVAKEWFLLPQVIGNAAWRVNCKPLAGSYYAGVTMAWLLPHVYGFLWPPYVNVHYTEANYGIMHYIYSKSAGVMVPVIGVMLALLVYVQQRWSYKTVGWAMRTHRNSKLPQHDY